MDIQIGDFLNIGGDDCTLIYIGDDDHIYLIEGHKEGEFDLYTDYDFWCYGKDIRTNYTALDRRKLKVEEAITILEKL